MKSLSASATGSGADRWLNCPGSVALEQGLKVSTEKYSEAGTDAHSAAAEVILRGLDREQLISYLKEQQADLDADAILKYVSIVRDSINEGDECFIEERLNYLGGSGGIDCYILHKNGKHASILDLKYGVGVPVSAIQNGQMAFYACALKAHHPKLTQVTITIVQPRIRERVDAEQISTWVMKSPTLKSWDKKFKKAYEQIEEATTLKAGEWCQFCKARPVCPLQLSLARRATQAARKKTVLIELPDAQDEVGMTLFNHDELLPKVALILAAEKSVVAWFKKAKDYVFYQLQNGKEVRGFEIGKKRANRQWNPLYDDSELASELQGLGVDEPWVEPKLITVAAAEKLIPKAKQDELDKLYIKPDNGHTLKLSKEFEDQVQELLDGDEELF